MEPWNNRATDKLADSFATLSVLVDRTHDRNGCPGGGLRPGTTHLVVGGVPGLPPDVVGGGGVVVLLRGDNHPRGRSYQPQMVGLRVSLQRMCPIKESQFWCQERAMGRGCRRVTGVWVPVPGYHRGPVVPPTDKRALWSSIWTATSNPRSRPRFGPQFPVVE